MDLKEWFAYGEKVVGYEVRVINEREARAAAGILLVVGMLSLTNAVMLGHGVVTRYFISFFTFDFLVRVIKPSYAPSMLMGRFFVQNQKPEYVGATQKRFAWMIGLMLAIPMFYFLVINWQPNPIKVMICILCLVLLFLESAFSICLGCKIYNLIMPNKATHCPGQVCEIQTKEKIQTFNTAQKMIVLVTFLAVIIGSYNYFYHLESKTKFGKFVSNAMMSQEDLKALELKAYQAEEDEFDNDDDF